MRQEKFLRNLKIFFMMATRMEGFRVMARPVAGKRGKKSKRVRLEDIAEACGVR
jgi:hypothetical protein